MASLAIPSRRGSRPSTPLSPLQPGEQFASVASLPRATSGRDVQLLRRATDSVKTRRGRSASVDGPIFILVDSSTSSEASYSRSSPPTTAALPCDGVEAPRTMPPEVKTTGLGLLSVVPTAGAGAAHTTPSTRAAGKSDRDESGSSTETDRTPVPVWKPKFESRVYEPPSSATGGARGAGHQHRRTRSRQSRVASRIVVPVQEHRRLHSEPISWLLEELSAEEMLDEADAVRGSGSATPRLASTTTKPRSRTVGAYSPSTFLPPPSSTSSSVARGHSHRSSVASRLGLGGETPTLDQGLPAWRPPASAEGSPRSSTTAGASPERLSLGEFGDWAYFIDSGYLSSASTTPTSDGSEDADFVRASRAHDEEGPLDAGLAGTRGKLRRMRTKASSGAAPVADGRAGTAALEVTQRLGKDLGTWCSSDDDDGDVFGSESEGALGDESGGGGKVTASQRRHAQHRSSTTGTELYSTPSSSPILAATLAMDHLVVEGEADTSSSTVKAKAARPSPMSLSRSRTLSTPAPARLRRHRVLPPAQSPDSIRNLPLPSLPLRPSRPPPPPSTPPTVPLPPAPTSPGVLPVPLSRTRSGSNASRASSSGHTHASTASEPVAKSGAHTVGGKLAVAGLGADAPHAGARRPSTSPSSPGRDEAGKGKSRTGASSPRGGSEPRSHRSRDAGSPRSRPSLTPIIVSRKASLPLAVDGSGHHVCRPVSPIRPRTSSRMATLALPAVDDGGEDGDAEVDAPRPLLGAWLSSTGVDGGEASADPAGETAPGRSTRAQLTSSAPLCATPSQQTMRGVETLLPHRVSHDGPRSAMPATGSALGLVVGAEGRESTADDERLPGFTTSRSVANFVAEAERSTAASASASASASTRSASRKLSASRLRSRLAAGLGLGGLGGGVGTAHGNASEVSLVSVATRPGGGASHSSTPPPPVPPLPAAHAHARADDGAARQAALLLRHRFGGVADSPAPPPTAASKTAQTVVPTEANPSCLAPRGGAAAAAAASRRPSSSQGSAPPPPTTTAGSMTRLGFGNLGRRARRPSFQPSTAPSTDVSAGVE